MRNEVLKSSQNSKTADSEKESERVYQAKIAQYRQVLNEKAILYD